MQVSWITAVMTISEAQTRIREARDAERLRFEAKIARHLEHGGKVIERSAYAKPLLYAINAGFGCGMGAESLAALLVRRYHELDTTLDFER